MLISLTDTECLTWSQLTKFHSDRVQSNNVNTLLFIFRMNLTVLCFVRIESRIESAATCSTPISIITITTCYCALHKTNDKKIKWSNRRTEMCRFSWFLKQYCTIAPTVLASVYMLLLHKHKIINIK